MKTLTVIVNVRGQSSDFRDARLAFWDAFANQSGYRASRSSNEERLNPEDFAAQMEQRIRRYLPQRLHREMSNALLGHRGLFETDQLQVSLVPRGRLAVTVNQIYYGSMKVELGIPDIDAYIELIGSNSDTFEALFGSYIPEAFDESLPGDISALDFKVEIPAASRNYINRTRSGGSAKSELTASEKGAAIMRSLIHSPLILPIILICFLWYYARQDISQERQITYGLIQTLVTQQTTVIGLLKDKQTTSSATDTSGEHCSADSASLSKPATGIRK